MIHLLEEQQGDKTNNIAEELILYLFLGIFVIFIVDSFAPCREIYSLKIFLTLKLFLT